MAVRYCVPLSKNCWLGVVGLIWCQYVSRSCSYVTLAGSYTTCTHSACPCTSVTATAATKSSGFRSHQDACSTMRRAVVQRRRRRTVTPDDTSR
eukprot:scaffold518_cov388-Prasinococcus_capsulatus_cf.AAC.3